MSVEGVGFERPWPNGDVAAMDMWAYQCNDGSERVSRVVVTIPGRVDKANLAHENALEDRWQCLVFIEHEMPGPQAVLGVGPVDALMNAAQIVAAFAHRVYHLTPRAPSQPPSAGAPSLVAPDPQASWRPKLAAIEDPVADDVYLEQSITLAFAGDGGSSATDSRRFKWRLVLSAVDRATARGSGREFRCRPGGCLDECHAGVGGFLLRRARSAARARRKDRDRKRMEPVLIFCAYQ